MILGKPEGTYHVKLGVAYFLPHVGMLVLAGLGYALFAGADPGWQTYVSAVVFLVVSIPFLFMAWRTFPTWRDELAIHENGFAYRSRRALQTCRWDEIEDFTEILDTGNRLKMTSVLKQNGEKITFAYKMRGLDVLSYEYHLVIVGEENEDLGPETDEIPELQDRTFGDLKGTYRVRFSVGYFIPVGATLFLAVFGVTTFVVSREIATFFICALPTSLVFLLLARSSFLDRRDELNIFENGFTYKNRKSTVDCLWEEIEDYKVTRHGTLTEVKKEDDPWISFANEMQGLDELKPHLKIIVKWTGPEE